MIIETKVIEKYKYGTPEQKKILEEIYGTDFFIWVGMSEFRWMYELIKTNIDKEGAGCTYPFRYGDRIVNVKITIEEDVKGTIDIRTNGIPRHPTFTDPNSL